MGVPVITEKGRGARAFGVMTDFTENPIHGPISAGAGDAD
jgi:hypothetical protein